MISMESGKKQARDELKIMIRVMLEDAINRNRRVYKNLGKSMAKKKGCKKKPIRGSK